MSSALAASRLSGLALLGVSVAALLWIAMRVSTSFEQEEFLFFLPRITSGLALTLFLAFSTFGLGFLLSMALLLLSLLSSRVARVIQYYQNLIRYTPLLAQLYLVYYGAGEISTWLDALHMWWLFREPLACVLLVFAINTTAYQSYILIGCVAAVPKGQREAGQALGLTTYPLLRTILLPQALRLSIKPLGNELVGMIKASSVASVVTVFDLLGQTQAIYAETFNLNYFLVAAAIYVTIVECVRMVLDFLAGRLSASYRPQATASAH